MGASPEIVINGKFLSAPPTGVHRVAQELSNALQDILTETSGGGAALVLSLWIPCDAITRASTMRLPVRVKRPLRSIPWEQLTLPFGARGRLILNLCNIGPVLSRQAVTMIHDAQVHISPASYRRGFRLWYKFVQPIVTRRHRHILTVSEFSRRQLISAGLGTADRISVIPNGVDHILAEAPDMSVIERLALEEQGYVVALASTQTHKNIRILLKAFADERLAKMKLVLVGTGNAADFAEQGLACPRNVAFAGRVSDAELRGLYEHALCIAFPSTTEGFGLPPMEAMLVGCPAIVAPCGALPEICGEAALYADPAMPEAWIESITALAKDREYRAARSAIGQVHARNFTWRRAAERLLAVLIAVQASPASVSVPA